MSTDRRFSDEEVAYILERAVAAEPIANEESPSMPMVADRTAPRGITLAQLKEIATESGLSVAAVSDAAAAVERGDLTPTSRTVVAGLPVGVSRTIALDRPVSDAEWERLVVALRETFQARGKVGREGSLRHWSNGNLQALLEPTATGYRLRLQTRKGDAAPMVGFGAIMLVAAALTAGGAVASGGSAVASGWLASMVALPGIAIIARTVFTLPRWARSRAAQMEAFAETASRILGESKSDALAAGESETRRLPE